MKRFVVTNEDDPLDIDYPREVGIDAFCDEPEIESAVDRLEFGRHLDVGGGAAVHFRIRRVR